MPLSNVTLLNFVFVVIHLHHFVVSFPFSSYCHADLPLFILLGFFLTLKFYPLGGEHTQKNIHTHTHMQRDTWNLCRRGFGLSYCLSKFHMLLHILDSGLLVYDFHRPISGCLRKIDHTQLLVYDFHRPVPGCLSKIDHTQWQNLLSTALFAPETKLITVNI